MATVTTNYGFDIPQSSDLVKDGATAIATLGQDIDTAMNTALGTKKAGMVLLNTTSFSAVASQSINDVFSATYDEYLIQLNGKGSTGAGVLFRLRASGSDATNATYNYQNLVASATSVSGSRSNTQTSWDVGDLDTTEKVNVIHLYNPFPSAVITSFATGNSISWVADNNTNPSVGLVGGSFTTTGTSYTGFTLTINSGNMTGSVKVYGFNK
jgi:hypothetical protein